MTVSFLINYAKERQNVLYVQRDGKQVAFPYFYASQLTKYSQYATYFELYFKENIWNKCFPLCCIVFDPTKTAGCKKKARHSDTL